MKCPFCGNEELWITSKKDFRDLKKNHGSATINIECIECSTLMFEHRYDGRDYLTKVGKLLDKWNERRMSNGIEKDQ